MAGLTGGRAITIYGQNEVVKDLIDARDATGRPLLFEVDRRQRPGPRHARPRDAFHHDDAAQEVTCDFIAGCDGFHGVCRPSIPAGDVQVFERVYPFALAGHPREAPPSSDELVYSLHERGFALFSMRSPRSRGCICSARQMKTSSWPDERIW